MTCGTRLLSMGELSCLDLDHVKYGWIAESGCRCPEGAAHGPAEYICVIVSRLFTGMSRESSSPLGHRC